MNIRFSSLIISTSLLLLCSASSVALADGMPFNPQPILTPIDKGLSNGNGQTKEQPLNIAPPEQPPQAQAPAPVQAEFPPPVPESRIVEVQPNTSFFGLSVGMYDPFTHGDKAASFNLEWQPGVKIAGVVQPLFGAIVTTNGAMLGYGGVGVPFNITDHVMMMPSVAAGAYKRGGGYDLDRTLVYRIGTELAYQFDDKSRIGLNIHVLTNGKSAQRKDRTEIIGLAYTRPFDVFSAQPAVMHDAVMAPAPADQALPPPAPALEPPANAAPAPEAPAEPAYNSENPT